jgi:DNA ligase 1
MGDEPFENRIEYLERMFGEKGDKKEDQIEVVHHEQATSRDHVLEKLKEIESASGEGLMLRKPGSLV